MIRIPAYQLFFFICILSSCAEFSSTADTISTSISPNYIQLELPTRANPSSRAMQHVYQDGSELLIFLDRNANRLLKYDLLKDGSLSEIAYELKGPKGVGDVLGFFYMNEDSILLTSKSYWTVFYSNEDAGYYNYLEFKELNDFNGIVYAQTTQPFVSLEGFVYMKQYPPSPFGMIGIEEYTSSSLAVKMDLVSKTTEHISATYPASYWKEHKFPPYGSVTSNEKELIFSFWYTNNLQIYNIQTAEVKEVELQGAFKSFVYANAKSPEESMQSLVRYPLIQAFVYDKYRELYYLLYYPGDSEIDISQYDLYNLAYNKPHLTIMIYDSEFNLLQTEQMQSFRYKNDNFFINKDGLHLSTNNVYNDEMEEDFIKFDLYQVNPL